jgi:undecaprenyl-diphosphatase
MPANRAKAFIGLVVGGVVLGVTGALARDGLSAAEVRVFRRFNSQTAPSFAVVWVPMQYGTLGAVPALAVAAIARRRPRVAVALGASGAAAWVLAKAVKPMVGRGRPATLLPDVRRRGEESGRDFGFPSGHAAVSAALTVAAWPYSASGWRIASAAMAGFVPAARLYTGVHLPLDVLGGSALGLCVASAVKLVLGAKADGEATQ